MTSNFQHQEPVWNSFCKSAPEPQNGRKAEKAATKVKDREPPKRRPAH